MGWFSVDYLTDAQPKSENCN